MSTETRRRVIAIVFGAVSGAAAFTSPVSAQEAGSELCGTPVESALNEFGPLIISALIVVGAFVAMIAHGLAGLHKDPDTVRFYRKWRNRSALTAVTVPVVGYFIEVALGIMGVGLASCIDLVPFI
ncbi:hypothetical protein [Halococcus sp. PRR34]|uniref:hypothetical protein n=1 Tax=Halococcus sp. PRR34 TaxID=3020830 RepID=UPI00235EE091|nr:hypothetical protein [Halococcus sp. PRR34]